MNEYITISCYNTYISTYVCTNIAKVTEQTESTELLIPRFIIKCLNGPTNERIVQSCKRFITKYRYLYIYLCLCVQSVNIQVSS